MTGTYHYVRIWEFCHFLARGFTLDVNRNRLVDPTADMGAHSEWSVLMRGPE